MCLLRKTCVEVFGKGLAFILHFSSLVLGVSYPKQYFYAKPFTHILTHLSEQPSGGIWGAVSGPRTLWHAAGAGD